ncbi:response regulator [Pseudothermotoga sp.]|uniref:response regulator n=1 Tax=Pseudothermotoga sp. TaxID=2033661 RepID=UPI0031F66FA6
MKKILVVEDNEKNRVLMRDLLTYNGYLVLEASNGKEGLEIAEREKPDLILMDIQMPIMDGFEAVEILKSNQKTKHIKVIALTSFAMKEEKQKILKSGVDGYISKPIKVPEFVDLVKKFLEE